MKRVIERCPNCGVEHDDPVGGACEVCGTTLRWWCRVHGPEIGFMDTAACPRCAAEAARPTPPPRPAPPRPAPPRPPAPRAPAPTRRPPYEVPPAAGEPRVEHPWMREERDPRVVFREHAEDLAPYAAAGAGFLVRLMLALVMVVRTVLGWGFLGALVGVVYATMSGVQLDVLWTAMAGAMIGGGIGLLLGTIRGLRILFAPPPDGPRR